MRALAFFWSMQVTQLVREFISSMGTARVSWRKGISDELSSKRKASETVMPLNLCGVLEVD